MGVGGNSWINNRPLRSSGLPNTEGCKIYVMTAGDQMEMCSGYTTLLQYPYLYRKKTDELQSPRENFHLMPYLIIKQSAGQIVSDSKNKCSTYLHYLFKVFFFKGHTFFFSLFTLIFGKQFWKHFYRNFPEAVPASMENFISVFICWSWHQKQWMWEVSETIITISHFARSTRDNYSHMVSHEHL